MTCNERVPLHSRMKKAAILCATVHFYCVSKLQCEIVKCGFKNVLISNKLILWQSHNILIPTQVFKVVVTRNDIHIGVICIAIAV